MMMQLKFPCSFVIPQKNRWRKLLKRAESAAVAWLRVAVGRCAQMEMSLPHVSTSLNMHVMKTLCVNAKLMINVAGHLRLLWGDVCKNYHRLDFKLTLLNN